MGQSYGPKLVTDSLILCLDAHDANSYAGEPVTNLVSSSAVDFSVRSGYTGNTFSQVEDSESPSGYACEMSYTGTVNSASRCRFGDADDIPTSGSGFVSIWAKKSAGTSATMRPKVYTGYTWYDLDPLDGGSIYFTSEYRPFGKAVTFGTSSSGPNPGFSMTHAGGSTSSDRTKWIKPQVTTLSYNVPFANLSRSATNGWTDLSGNGNHGTLTNMTGTGASHYKDGQVIKPLANSYLDFDGSNDYVATSFGSGRNPHSSPTTFVAWVKSDTTTNNKMWLDHGSNGTNQRLYSALITADNTTPFGIQSSAWSLPSNADTSKWYHQALVMDSGTARGYYDGIPAGTKSYSSYTLPGNTRAGGRASYIWDGQIACFAVYDKALSAAEVKKNFNAQRRRFGV